MIPWEGPSGGVVQGKHSTDVESASRDRASI